MSDLRLKCTKFNFGWGSAPDPAGGAYHATENSPQKVREYTDIFYSVSRVTGLVVVGRDGPGEQSVSRLVAESVARRRVTHLRYLEQPQQISHLHAQQRSTSSIVQLLKNLCSRIDVQTHSRPATRIIFLPTLVSIAQAVFLLERGQSHIETSHRHTNSQTQLNALPTPPLPPAWVNVNGCRI